MGSFFSVILGYLLIIFKIRFLRKFFKKDIVLELSFVLFGWLRDYRIGKINEE